MVDCLEPVVWSCSVEECLTWFLVLLVLDADEVELRLDVTVDWAELLSLVSRFKLELDKDDEDEWADSFFEMVDGLVAFGFGQLSCAWETLLSSFDLVGLAADR